MADSEPNKQRRRLTATVLALTAQGMATRSLCAPGADAGFPVFDALLHRGKPNLSREGLEHMFAVANIWRPGASHQDVDEGGVIAALNQLPPQATTLYVDVENWRLLGVAAAVRDQSVQNYLATARIIRRVKPHLRFGFYGIAPSCVYWPIVRQDPQQLAEWRAVNRAMLPLADYVDFVLPSLYTFYDDPDGWRRFASATLEEAHRYTKPVYPFVWFEYFDGNPILRGQPVRVADWREELALCRKRADGIVLWGGYEHIWTESAGWWQAVLEFLSEPILSGAQRDGKI
jgi:hypothetical protein